MTPLSISHCPHGHYLLQFGATTIHLLPADFHSFVTMALESLGSEMEGERGHSPGYLEGPH